jgi:hypothetical protein
MVKDHTPQLVKLPRRIVRRITQKKYLKICGGHVIKKILTFPSMDIS